MRITKIVEKLLRKVSENSMDILISAELKSGYMSGYDILSLIHKRFGILVSQARFILYIIPWKVMV